MKKILFLLAIGISLSSANVEIGQYVFKKHLRKACGFSGVSKVY